MKGSKLFTFKSNFILCIAISLVYILQEEIIADKYKCKPGFGQHGGLVCTMLWQLQVLVAAVGLSVRGYATIDQALVV